MFVRINPVGVALQGEKLASRALLEKGQKAFDRDVMIYLFGSPEASFRDIAARVEFVEGTALVGTIEMVLPQTAAVDTTFEIIPDVAVFSELRADPELVISEPATPPSIEEAVQALTVGKKPRNKKTGNK